MKELPLKTRILHFIGIGGIGMSGIAEILHQLGHKVQGSDCKESINTKRLAQKGIKIFIGHNEQNIAYLDGNTDENIDVVVFSSAVKADNPEIIATKARRIPVIRRAEMLAELMRFKNTIAIAGTHGKTTTTSLIGHVMEKTGLDPTVVNGGIVNSYGSNIRMGDSDWMVVEVDESDGSFTILPSSIGVITNIDPEHMDFYGSFEEVKESYIKFASRLPFYGFLVACIENKNVKEITENIPRKIVTYGFSEESNVRATNLKNTAEGMVFDVNVNIDKNSYIINDVLLPMFGTHNVLNSLASIATCSKIGVKGEDIKTALKSFAGVKRRFTLTGTINNIRIIDDYAHHPQEIKAVLETAKDILRRESLGGRIIAVMQPHRYSRLHEFFDDFVKSFDNAKTVIVADVYAAGEAPITGADKEHLVEALKLSGKKSAIALEKPDDLPSIIANTAKENDMIIFLGAGDITAWAQQLPEQLANINASSKAKYANG